MRVLRAAQRAEVFAFRRENPQPARPTDENISGLVHLDTVDRVLARRAGHVEKQCAFAEGAISINRVAVDDLVLFIPITDVKEVFVRGERQAVRSREVRAHKPQPAVMDGIDPGEWGLATGIIMELWQSERRIGEKQRSIAAIDEIVWRVQTLTIVAVGEDGGEAVLLDADDAAVTVLAKGQPAFRVNSQAV